MIALMTHVTRIALLLIAVAGFSKAVAASSSRTPSPGAPVAFERNVGQAQYEDGRSPRPVDAVLRIGATTAYIHGQGLDILQQALHRVPNRDPYEPQLEVDVLRSDLRLIASNPHPRVEFLSPQPGVVRYINAYSDINGVVADRFGSIVYHDVWPGIDMRLYLTPLGLKYDFVVHPGADPNAIAFRYDGTSAPTLDEDGNLIVRTQIGSLNEQAPVVFTTDLDGSQRSPVNARYVVSGSSVRFKIGNYDQSRLLVVDPQRIWATYYGGNNTFESAFASVDPSGNVIIAGTTLATNMPSVPGVLQRAQKGGTDGYVTKFDENGKFLWHTYYGGKLSDRLNDVTTDARGNIWTCGQSNSVDRPEFTNVLFGSAPYGDPEPIELAEAIVLKLTADGKWADSWEVYGRESDVATGIAVSGNRVAIVGHTKSPRLGGLFGEAPWRKNTANSGDNIDLFVSIVKGTKDPNKSDSTKWVNDYIIYYGGDDDELGGKIGFDKQGNVIFSGITYSGNFPVTDGSRYKDFEDIGVVKFGPTPTRLWASVFGSSNFEDIGDLAIDSKGDVVLAGTTYGTDFPAQAALQNVKRGYTDGYVRKYTSAGTVAWSTHYGGDSSDYLRGVAIDRNDNIWVAGSTGRSPNIPLTEETAIQKTPFALSGTDGIVGKLNPAGSVVLFGSFLGAPPQTNLPTPPPPPPPPPPIIPPNTDFGNDELFDVALDNNAYVVLTGKATSYRMTTTTGAYQDSSNLDKDTLRTNAFVAFLSQCKDSVITIIPNGPATLCDVDSRQLVGPKGFARYRWSNGDTTQTTIVRDSGSYTLLCVTVDGCRYRDTIFIGRNPKPTVSAGRDTTLCIKSSVDLRATPNGGTAPYRFKWNRVETGVEFIITDDTLQAVSVNPGTTSRYEVTVTDAAGCSARDTVLVTVIDPKVGIGPQTVDFGTIDACASSSESTVSITNTNAYEIRITGFVPDDPRLSLLTSTTPGIVVAPGASVDLRLRVSASVAGSINGSFTVTGAPCSWSVSGKYAAKKDQLTATITPGVVSFGASLACDTEPKIGTAIVTNSGKVDLVVSPATVSAPFTLVSPTAQFTLKPGEKQDVTFRYTPTVGVQSVDVVFPFESGACKDSLRVKLNALTSEITATVTPSSINAGTLSGCENQKDTTVTIDNTSNVGITVTLPNDPEVVYTPSGPIDIPAKSSVQVQVALRPGSTGPFSKSQDLRVAPCDRTISVSYALQKNGIAFTAPSTVDFGEFSSCTPGTSTLRTSTLSFDGTGTASIKSVTTSPRIATSLAAGQALAAGQSSEFTITWTPDADGPMVDSIVLTFDPCDVRRVIRLAGTRTRVALRADNPTVALGTITNTASGKVRFTNVGTDTITVGVTSISAGTAVDNAVPGPLVNVLPGSEVVVDYTTACRDRTVISDTLEASVLLPCAGVRAQSAINATCEKSTVVTSTVSIDSVRVKVGEQFIVPVRLRSSQGLNAAGAAAWRATLTYDPAVIVGRTNTTDCWLPNTPGPCSITIQGTRGADTVGTLFALNYTAVLGSTDRSALTLTDFQWIGVNGATIEKRNGLVTITDICREGGDRYLIEKRNGFDVRVYPSPATSDVTIDVTGLGTDELSWVVTNMLGEVLERGASVGDASGALLRTLDVSAFGAGTYTMTISARGTVTNIPFVIQR
ncbi:MAG: hypothetical protein RL594_877 [Bacteroidota bacterium]|jgi:hypothetical protein